MMYSYPDPGARAVDFARRASLPHSYRRPLANAQAQSLVQQCEALFLQVTTATRPGCKPGQLLMRHRDGELSVRFSGNLQKGSMVLARGESHYTQVNFEERAITIFQSQSAGFSFIRTDTGAVVDRRRPKASASYGRTPNLDSLLKATA